MKRIEHAFGLLAVAAGSSIVTLSLSGFFSRPANSINLDVPASTAMTEAMNTMNAKGKPILTKQDLAQSCQITADVQARSLLISNTISRHLRAQ